MKRLLIAYAFALVGVLLPVLPAQAGIPLYAGNLQVVSGGTLTFKGSGGGCALVNSTGQVYIAACPVGTVAFSASSPFTVTGNGPYVIGCPTCLTTSGGSITGVTSFSNGVTFNGATTVNGSFTSNGNSTITGTLFFGPSGVGQISTPGSGTTVQGVPCTVIGILGSGSAKQCTDTLGNEGVAGQVTASQFNVGSKRAWKYDIHPLPFDALQVLHDTEFASFRYRPGHGDPRLPHVGIIADDSPSVLSGEKHDHLDIEALATVDAKAVLQLETQINVLYVLIVSVGVLVLLLVVALGLVWRDKTAS